MVTCLIKFGKVYLTKIINKYNINMCIILYNMNFKVLPCVELKRYCIQV